MGCLLTKKSGLEQGASYLLSHPSTDKISQDFHSMDCSTVCVQCKGWRRSMEDVAFVKFGTRKCLPSGPDGDKNEEVLVAAVFDGHAGKQAADYACSHLVEHIERSEPEWSQGDLEGACRKGFIACDASMREAGISSGTTAVVAYVTRTELFVANCGDSRAVLSRGGRQMPMSLDHKPNRKAEARRIVRNGGTLDSSDPRAMRIVSRQSKFSIATSRALGDFDFKQATADPEDHIVTCLPEYYRRERQPDDDFLILASDGLWDVMTSPDVASYLTVMKSQGKSNPKGPGSSLQSIASGLIDRALELSSTDNISIILVDLCGVYRAQSNE